MFENIRISVLYVKGNIGGEFLETGVAGKTSCLFTLEVEINVYAFQCFMLHYLY